MPKYGKNLEQIFRQQNNKLPFQTIIQIGLKLIDIIEMIHAAGYTYNDLKLDNILIGDHQQTEHSMNQVRLIDFGFAQKFIDHEGHHIEQDDVDVFRSNMIFATVDQFEFKTSSRKDDLQSLCYMLAYLFKSGDVPFVDKDNMSQRETFVFIKGVKEKLEPQELVDNSIENHEQVAEFLKEVFAYGFKDTPNYTKLKVLLMKAMPTYTF